MHLCNAFDDKVIKIPVPSPPYRTQQVDVFIIVEGRWPEDLSECNKYLFQNINQNGKRDAKSQLSSPKSLTERIIMCLNPSASELHYPE